MTHDDTVTLRAADLAQQLADAEARGMVEERRRWEARVERLRRLRAKVAAGGSPTALACAAIIEECIAIMEGREP